jgi:hypothetical protein
MRAPAREETIIRVFVTGASGQLGWPARLGRLVAGDFIVEQMTNAPGAGKRPPDGPRRHHP